VTEFSYKGSTITLDNADLTLVPWSAPTGGSENILVDSLADIAASNFSLTGIGGALVFHTHNEAAPGHQGVGVGDDKLNNGESIVVDFDLVDYGSGHYYPGWH